MSSFYIYDDITAAMARSAQSSFPLLLLIHGPSNSSTNTSSDTVDGAAQRARLIELVEKTGLSAVSVIHILEQGTANYNNFIAVDTQPNLPLPQIRIYAPPRSKEPVKILYGAKLNTADLYLVVTAALQLGLYGNEDEMLEMMQLRSDSALGNGAPNTTNTGGAANGSSTNTNENDHPLPTNPVLAALQEQLQTTVEAMNRERQRSQPQSLTAAASAATAALPSKSRQAQSTTTDVKKTPPGNAAKPPAVHLVHIEGLPHGRTRAVWTQPTMRLSTIWNDVRAALQRAVKEMQDAKEAGVFDGLAKEDRFLTNEAPERFALRLHKHSQRSASDNKNANEEEEGEKDVYVRSAAEAEAMLLQEILPSGSIIHVILPGSETEELSSAVEAEKNEEEEEQQEKKSVATSKTASSASPSTPLQQQPHNEELTKGAEAVTDSVQTSTVLGGARVVCTGDSCVLVPRTTTATTTYTPHTPSEPNKTSVSEAAKSSAAPATNITLRCSLPDGRMESVTGLCPQSDTLAQHVRPAIRALLGHDQFLFVRAYPPRRFNITNDETQPLQALGFTSSAALRVVINEDATSAGSPPGVGVAQRSRASRLLSSITGVGSRNSTSNSSTAAPAETSTPPHHTDPGEAMNTNLLTSMLRRLMSSANTNPAADPRTNAVGGGGGRRLAGNESESNTNNSGGFPFASASRPPPTTTGASSAAAAGGGRGNFRCMADVVDEQEEEQQRMAQQRLLFSQMAAERLRALRDVPLTENNTNNNRNTATGAEAGDNNAPTHATNNNNKGGKSNRYFGGDSTEYMAHDDFNNDKGRNDEAGDESGDEGEEGTAQQQRFSAFTGEGRRLAGSGANEPGPHARQAKDDDAEDKKKK